MAVMETVGFAAIFRHGRAVAVAGALGMGLPATLAWARRIRRQDPSYPEPNGRYAAP